MKQHNLSRKFLSIINIIAAAVFANLANIAQKVYPIQIPDFFKKSGIWNKSPNW